MVSVLRPQLLPLKASPSPRTGPPMFLYGLGAAKCGTTWLYDYLSGHPDCHIRGVKELNYFSAINTPNLPREIEKLESKILRVESELRSALPANAAKGSADLLDMRDYLRVLKTCHQDKNAYFRYMMLGLQRQKLVADISPNYSYVTPDMLATMVTTAPETRFLYIIRDPVSRFWSHLRMNVRKGLTPGADFDTELRSALKRELEGPKTDVSAHSDYALVISNMEEAVPADRRLVMFYEDLMSPSGIKVLCRFLNIKPIKADIERVVYQGRAADLTADERKMLGRFFRPQYEAVAARFPVLPKAWQKTMAESLA